MLRDRYAPAGEHGTGNQIKCGPTAILRRRNYGQKSNGFRSAKYRTRCAGNKLRHELDAAAIASARANSLANSNEQFELRGKHMGHGCE
jgi:hypothetical protein